MNPPTEETFVPHVGWLAHERGDDVARYLREGWFEFIEQAVFWLYLRPGDVVIDCGAHIGLFTLLSSAAVGEYGRVLALEPNPETLTLLRRNIEAASVATGATGGAGSRNVEIIPVAAASKTGAITLHAGGAGASAYSSAVASVKQSSDVQVRAATIDDLLAARGIDKTAMLKIDVEGAELDAWRGAAQTAAAGGLSLAMIEFTESNQQAAGLSSTDLAAALENDGYRLHRFNPRSMQMEAAAIEGPIEYENLFASRDIEPVTRRLREASPQRQRIARDVLARGAACFAQMKRGSEVEHFRQLTADLQRRLDDALREAGELADARQRVLEYARFIDGLFNSRGGRVARALRLVHPPIWVETLKRDVQQGESASAAERLHD